MKKLITLIVVMASFTGFAQSRAGIYLTPYFQLGTAGTKGDVGTVPWGGVSANGPYVEAGADIKYFFNNHWAIGAGMGYDVSHVRYNHFYDAQDNIYYTTRERLKYLQFPLYASYVSGTGKKPAFYAKAGFKLAFLLADHTEFHDYDNGYLLASTDSKVETRKCVLNGFTEAGLVYPLGSCLHLMLGVGGFYGFTQLYTSTFAEPTERMYAIYGRAGLEISLSNHAHARHSQR